MCHPATWSGPWAVAQILQLSSMAVIRRDAPPALAEVDFDRDVAADLSAWYRCPNEMAPCT